MNVYSHRFNNAFASKGAKLTQIVETKVSGKPII